MANRPNVGGLSSHTSDEELKTFFQQVGALQSATMPGEPQPAGAARTPGSNWDDEEDWQRFFL